jgi:REP element-mobilizing transposase RayT
MPINSKYLADLTEENIYHVYNRTNNKELLFRTDKDRFRFLIKYDQYLAPYWDTYCWSLLPNHFHWLVRIKTIDDLKKMLHLKKSKELDKIEKQFLDSQISTEILLENACQRFFTSYAMGYNCTYDRKGNLFHRPFKRIEVVRETQFTQAVVYIHANPLKHNIVTNFMEYEWSSWKTIMSEGPTTLLRQELIDWFGSKKLLIKAHRDLSVYYYESEIAIEE